MQIAYRFSHFECRFIFEDVKAETQILLAEMWVLYRPFDIVTMYAYDKLLFRQKCD